MAVSVIIFLGIVLSMPILLINIPINYFANKRNEGIIRGIKFPFNILLLVIKNIIGFLLIIVGIILLFAPGQGILTVFSGLILMNFPGKRRLELYVVRKHSVINVINWIRGKAGKQLIKDIYQG